jgi:hypothetical protein
MFPPLPSDQSLRIMWQVAVTSAVEDQSKPWKIFARLLYYTLRETHDNGRLFQEENDR